MKENNVFNMSVNHDVRKSQKAVSIFDKVEIKIDSLKEITFTQYKHKALQQLVLSSDLKLAALRSFKKFS